MQKCILTSCLLSIYCYIDLGMNSARSLTNGNHFSSYIVRGSIQAISMAFFQKNIETPENTAERNLVWCCVSKLTY